VGRFLSLAQVVCGATSPPSKNPYPQADIDHGKRPVDDNSAAAMENFSNFSATDQALLLTPVGACI
jgi:hypothetical protein